MNLSSQNTNYQSFIGYNMSDNNDLISMNTTFNQEDQLNSNIGYNTGFNQINEQIKQTSLINNRLENETDENGFETTETLLSKLDNSNDSKRQKKQTVPIVQNSKANSYYMNHYNQSLTGSSISSNSSSTSSSPLSLSSPLHNSNIHFNNNNHLNLQLKQPSTQSQSLLATNNPINYHQQTSLLPSLNHITNSSHNQPFLYNDTNNMFSYHSINKIIPIIENNDQQFSLNHDLNDSTTINEFKDRIKIKKSKKDPITEYDIELAESIEFELGLKKQNGPRKNSWGNLSYAELITRAIESSCDQRLTLSQIYDWIVKYVPYFKEKFDRTSSAGWKNSIRHNLSLHNRFIRVQNESSGKSSWWMINPDITKYSLNPINSNTHNTSLQSGTNDANSFIEPLMIDNNIKVMNDNNMDINNNSPKMLNNYSSDNNKSTTKDVKPFARRVNGLINSQKHDQSRLSSNNSNNYASISPNSGPMIKNNCTDLTNKRSKITKHKLNQSKLNKNNLNYKNTKLKHNKHEESDTKMTNSKCENLLTSATSSSTPSSSLNDNTAMSNDILSNRVAFSSITNSSSLPNTDLSAETSSILNSTLKSNGIASTTPPPNINSPYQNSNSSSILRAALQKSVSTNMTPMNCLTNPVSSQPPTPSATPTLLNQTNYNNSQNFTKQFQNNNNNSSFIQMQSNPYNFSTTNQTDFGYSMYPNNAFNTTTNGLQLINNQPNYSNENSYFTSLNNSQMIVPSPGSSISTSSSPSSSTSSSSSLTATMTFLNRSNNTNNTQISSKPKPPLVSQEQHVYNNNNYSLQSQQLNSNQIYQSNFNNQTTFENNQRSTNNILFSPLSNASSTKPTYYDLSKNIQLQSTTSGQSVPDNSIVSNSCGSQLNHSNLMYDDLSSYQDLLNNSNSKPTISCFYN